MDSRSRSDLLSMLFALVASVYLTDRNEDSIGGSLFALPYYGEGELVVSLGD